MVDCAFSTRLGGVSRGSYAELNLSLHVEDEPHRVIENRRRFFKGLNMNLETWVSARQVHGDSIQVVTKQHAGRGLFDNESTLPGVDALITRDMDVTLVALFADCVPVFLVDPVERVIGMVHAGWKGTVNRISSKAVQTMERVFGSKADTCIALIGPSIGSCCYEIGMDVANKIKETFPDTSDILRLDETEGKIFCDLQVANRISLESAGLLRENIHGSGLCTSCRTDVFYSYRKEGTTGRLAGVIRLCRDRC
jgi:YfiH family protein